MIAFWDKMLPMNDVLFIYNAGNGFNYIFFIFIHVNEGREFKQFNSVWMEQDN